MKGRDNEIRVHEILHGDPSKLYDKRAYHNKDGLFVMPEEEKSDVEFVERGGIFVPKPPDIKECWIIAFDFGATLEVEESRDDIQAAIDQAHLLSEQNAGVHWFTFTDPIFGTTVSIPSTHLLRVYSIYVHFRNMEQTQFELEVQRQMMQEQRFQYALQNSKRNGKGR